MRAFGYASPVEWSGEIMGRIFNVGMTVVANC